MSSKLRASFAGQDGVIVEVTLKPSAPKPSAFALDRRLADRRARRAEALAIRAIERRLADRRKGSS